MKNIFCCIVLLLCSFVVLADPACPDSITRWRIVMDYDTW